MTNDELYHYGISGMKWGVRRTNAELSEHNRKHDERHNKRKSILGNAGTITQEARKLNRSASKLSKKTPDLSNMSNKELQDKITRMNLERQYKDLMREQTSKGAAKVDAVLDKVGASIGIASSAIVIAETIHKMTKK